MKLSKNVLEQIDKIKLSLIPQAVYSLGTVFRVHGCEYLCTGRCSGTCDSGCNGCGNGCTGQNWA